MARKASELAESAAVTLQVARDEVIATGDPETISWALDQFRQAEALLQRVIADCDAPPGEVKGATEAA
jgi:ATP-dependent Zn protease